MSPDAQAKSILQRVKFGSLATVNADGTPHNSPLVLLYDERFEYVYWGSHPESLHSQNVERTGRAFLSVFDSLEGHTGVYAELVEAQAVSGEALVEALRVHNRFRRGWGKHEIELGYYQGKSPQLMWRAKVARVWVNAYERGEDGRLVRDYKVEVKKGELGEVWR